MNGAQAPAAGATYRILRELGVRAQKTYAAIREPNELVVVQKFARAPGSIEREARALAKNWHPNLARVRHVETIADELFIATDFVDGVTLADLYAAGASKRAKNDDPYLPLPLLTRITVDILGGLQGMHGLRDEANAPLGAFHGAVCPANVVIGKDGVARLIALHRMRPVRVVSASESLCYAAPEALEQGSAADPRTDLYAAAVMIWEGVLGQRLHQETQPARVAARQREEEILWAETTDPVLTEIGRVVLRALAFDPLLRYRSAWELATELRKAAGTQLAPGSAVAQKVVELGGERLRTRRVELEPAGARKASVRDLPKTPAPLPVAEVKAKTTAIATPPPATVSAVPKPPSPASVSKAPELPRKPQPPASVSRSPEPPKKPPLPQPRKPEPKVEIAPLSDPSVQAALVSEPQLPATPKSDPALRTAAPRHDPALRTVPIVAQKTAAEPRLDPVIVMAPTAPAEETAPPVFAEEPKTVPAVAPKPRPLLAVTPTPPPADAEPVAAAAIATSSERVTDAGVDVPIVDEAPAEITTTQSIAVFLKKPIPARRAAIWVIVAAAAALMLTIGIVLIVLSGRTPTTQPTVAEQPPPAAPTTAPTSLVTSTLPVETATPPPTPPPATDNPPAAETATGAPPEEPTAEAPAAAPQATETQAAQPAAPTPPPVTPPPATPPPPRKTKLYEPLGI